VSHVRLRCPHCDSSDIVYLSNLRRPQWECHNPECRERFDGEALPPEPLATLTSRAADPKAIFFSYGHDHHAEFVELLKADLEQRGHTVWFDKKDIGAWDDWKGRITEGIDGSHMTVAFMSRHALRDPGVCRHEIDLALQRHGTVYPVLLEASAVNDVPITVRDLQWPDLSQWQAIRDGEVPGVEWERWYQEHLLNLIEKIEGTASRFANEVEALRTVLAPSNHETKIREHLVGFVGRQWVFDAFVHWADHQSDSRLFWLKAGPGVGKTAIAAQLATGQRSKVAASWFCDAGSSELSDPARAVRSIAFQLALRMEDYRVRLLRTLGVSGGTVQEVLTETRRELDRTPVEDLWRRLVVEPLGKDKLIWRDHKLVILIDGLDEASDEHGHNALAAFIGRHIGSLPGWVGLAVTSRPEAAVTAHLRGFKPFEIDAQDERNRQDLEQWYRQHLSNVPAIAALPADDQQRLQSHLLGRSEGMFLYLAQVVRGLQEGSLTVDTVKDVQAGVGGLYALYHGSFGQRFAAKGMEPYRQHIAPLLDLVLAADGPLPRDLAERTLGWGKEALNDARLQLGSYLVESPEGLSLFHKTLGEWLERHEDNPFYRDAAPARQQLADVLFEALEEAGDDLHTIHIARWSGVAARCLPQWLPRLKQGRDASRITLTAHLLRALGRYVEAEPLYREVLRMVLEAGRGANEFPEAAARANLAEVLQALGHLDEAVSLYHEALAIHLDASTPDTQRIINATYQLAHGLHGLEQFDEAERLYRRALELIRSQDQLDHPQHSNVLNGLAAVLKASGTPREAEQFYWRALEVEAGGVQPRHLTLARIKTNLSVLLQTAGRLEEAEALARQALEIVRTELPEDHPDVAVYRNNLAHLLQSRDQLDEAEALFREALTSLQRALPVGHRLQASVLSNLACLLNRKDQVEEALRLHWKALEIHRACDPAPRLDIAGDLTNLATLLYSLKRYDEAEPLAIEALELRRAVLPPEHPAVADSARNAAAVLAALGRHEEAAALLNTASERRAVAFPTYGASGHGLAGHYGSIIYRFSQT
jgi:tetratricopeptide (TPR) repeat protein